MLLCVLARVKRVRRRRLSIHIYTEAEKEGGFCIRITIVTKNEEGDALTRDMPSIAYP